MDNNLEEDKNRITERFFGAINISNLELFSRIKIHYDKVKSIYPMIEFVIERLIAVTSLTTQNYLWDAEIIYRSALETLIKLLFITSSNKDVQNERLNEYWNDLAEINSIKQSEQAKKILMVLGNNEIMKLAFSPIVLDKEKEEKLKTKWNKRNRKLIEQKWSFSELISSLSNNYKGNTLEPIAMLAHGYRMSSHLSHGDETGILIIRERKSRSEEQQIIADFSHYIRLMSDSFTYSLMTAVSTMNFLNEDPKYFYDLHSSMKDIYDITQNCQLKLYDDADYDKYRKC